MYKSVEIPFEKLEQSEKEKFYKNQHIQLMYDNKVVTDIVIKDNELTYTKYTNNTWDQLFIYEPIDFEFLYIIFESRVMHHNTPNNPWLKYYGLEKYSVYDLIKKTHGVNTTDKFWFKFDNEIYNEIDFDKLKKYITPTIKEFEDKTGCNYVQYHM